MVRIAVFLFVTSLLFVLSHQDLVKSLTPSSMVLPLFFKAPNSTRHFAKESSRRQLMKSNPRKLLPDARMRLYDNLLINGYYTTRLWIGTPPQEFALIVDTGSTVTYVPCATCEQCGKHQDPRFQPDLSDTYKPVKCNIDCSCNDEKSQCTYERQYAEMSSSSGVLGNDIVSFGNESALEPQRAVFGCENEETGDLYSQRADGIMGLGRGPLSIVDQLVQKRVISDSFSLCYGGMDIGGGAMILGGISPQPDMVFARSNPVRSPYYNIELKEIHVAGNPLKLNPRVFDGKHGTVLDSGTTYAYLPEPAFIAFKEAIFEAVNHLKQIRGPDPNYKDICFSGAGSYPSELFKTFPEVNFVFGNGQKLLLAPENYLFRHSKLHDAYCLGIFQNGKDPTTLLGGIVVRNTLVTYDRANEKVGFLKTNCSELWETLHVPSSTVPATNNSKNSTQGVPPSVAPTGLPEYIAPGEFQIGVITFDISLSVNYSDLKPHIKELAEFIAHELEVNTTQVNLMNITDTGNGSLIKCTILPEGSANYIPNSRAMNIFHRLAEHQVQLPPTFGSYRLIEWKVEPPSTRTWWDEHFLVVVLGVIVTFFLCLTMFGVWYAWKRRQPEVIPYKPVAVVVPDQELQQLELEEINVNRQ